MSGSHLLPALWFALAAALPAQQTALDEDFDAGVVPPAGWTEQNVGANDGWEPDRDGLEAEHDDYVAGSPSDSRLVTPSLDLSGYAEAWLHFVQDQQFASFRDVNDVQLSLDGGLTFQTIWSATVPGEVDALPVHVDLSAWAGQPDVQLGFLYQGDYANVWRVDDVVVDDVAPPPPPPHWPNLPSVFLPAEGFRLDFETAAGTVPPHLAVNALDALTRLPDAEAWCHLGQQAACLEPYDGAYALELGLAPGSTDYHEVANGLVLGLDGTGASDLTMSFQAIHHGEELDAGDGVFVSSDGVVWESVLGDWEASIGAPGAHALVTCDLASTSVDVSGPFYALIAQQDDFPYAELDGVGIDNLTVGAPILDVPPVFAGASVDLKVRNADPAGVVVLAYAFSPGPTATPYGDAALGPDYRVLDRYKPDAQGELTVTVPVPGTAAGLQVWLQALEVVAGAGSFSNGVTRRVQ